MTELTRRSLIQTTAATAAAAAFHGSVANGAPQNDRLKLGFIGFGGGANSLVKPFLDLVDIVWARDADQQRTAQFAKADCCQTPRVAATLSYNTGPNTDHPSLLRTP